MRPLPAISPTAGSRPTRRPPGEPHPDCAARISSRIKASTVKQASCPAPVPARDPSVVIPSAAAIASPSSSPNITPRAVSTREDHRHGTKYAWATQPGTRPNRGRRGRRCQRAHLGTSGRFDHGKTRLPQSRQKRVLRVDYVSPSLWSDLAHFVGGLSCGTSSGTSVMALLEVVSIRRRRIGAHSCRRHDSTRQGAGSACDRKHILRLKSANRANPVPAEVERDHGRSALMSLVDLAGLPSRAGGSAS